MIKNNELKNKEITLCDVSEASKLAHYTKVITSKEENPNIELDFSSSELKGYDNFDILIIAEQLNNAKLLFLSDILSNNSSENSGTSSNFGLIIVIALLSILLVVGGVIAILILRKYKGDGSIKNVIDAKSTSMSDLSGTKNEKLIASQAVA